MSDDPAESAVDYHDFEIIPRIATVSLESLHCSEMHNYYSLSGSLRVTHLLNTHSPRGISKN